MLKQFCLHCVHNIWHITTYPFKWILSGAIKFVLNRPGLRQFLHRQLVRFPWIYWKLYNFAVNRKIFLDGAAQTNMDSGSDMPTYNDSDSVHNLSPRARQIYEKLKVAVEHNKSSSC
ncbi:hypothetical protein EDC27_0402 [Desulfosoma caldarium]|uniref:Uncharacterized protein n=1 Tax=Desulfosoma caldarium TaxID=610254 RepID=A0A3N1VJZ9_9BACT|nr:hypothetical protein EDC27_0402 [Desulfosoma caldarium]